MHSKKFSFESIVSHTYYTRSVLLECKDAYITFEKDVLSLWHTTTFWCHRPQSRIFTAAMLWKKL
ncbi:hypothetical protein M405DRAFT_811258 [Rhizopogon salebrosus TDB-379]|nr:hypothetical protein M405DRAFT_811258 [Rhizopogon salebrosus TDB-379]